MITCKECATTEPEGTLFCSECGHSFIKTNEQSTAQLPFADSSDDPLPPSLLGQELDPVLEARQVTFVIPSSGRRISLNLQKDIQIGRSDPDQDIQPALDLTKDNGAEYGVSRLHAVIQVSHRGVALVDLNSTNGTLLNNYRLPPELPYPLHNGDEIRFGRLLTHIFFD